MPEAAVIAWVVFGLTSIVWRFWHQRRSTGEFGLRRFSPAVTLVALSFAVAVAVPVLEVSGILERSVAPNLQIAAGIAAMALGFGLTLVAQIQMGPSWRVGVQPGERTELVTHGLFRYIRNPIFSGVIVSAVGAALLVPKPAMMIAAVGSLVGIELQVRRVEEPHLEALHGAAYTDYARRVGRFLPGVGKAQHDG